jgi:hypothetical protein
MREHERARRRIHTAGMLEDLADTIRECSHGTDDSTRSRMATAASSFSQRAAELRAQVYVAAVARGDIPDTALKLDL